MSQRYRNPASGVPPCVPHNMIPSTGAVGVGVPTMFSSAQTPYNVTGFQQPFASTSVYASPFQNKPPGISVVTTGHQIYVPVQQIPTNTFTNVAPLQRNVPVDPTKLMEERRKFEKERNFEALRQRLKQFTVSGKKGNLNAENLIDSMFGKHEIKHCMEENKQKSVDVPDPLTSPQHSVLERPSPVLPSFENTNKENLSGNKPVTCSEKDVKKNVKSLEGMMQECSNLSGPQKAKTFSKSQVSGKPVTVLSSATFTPSEKSINWNNVQQINKVFLPAKPRFPEWCKKEHVPPLYHQIEAIVTENNSHVPDTNLLYPIFLSSGLPSKLLGQVWDIVNCTTPGNLTQEEMYAALALIAVAQAGHQITNAEILHHLPGCPTPLLHCFNKMFSQTQPSLPEIKASSELNSDLGACSPNVIFPPATFSTSFKNHQVSTVTSNISSETSVAEEKVLATSQCLSAENCAVDDDDFDDFKCAPVTTNGPPCTSVNKLSLILQDSSELKQAFCNTPTFNTNLAQSVCPILSSNALVTNKDLMSSDEDKYSIFRLLQEKENTDLKEQKEETITLLDCDADGAQISDASSLCQKIKYPSNDELVTNKEKDQEDDDFGEFLHADITSDPLTTVTSHSVSQFSGYSNFANFSKLNSDFISNNEYTANMKKYNVPSADISDDLEFGEFASHQASVPKLDVQDFVFHIKDNISLAETQSVSSLEFGTFDGGANSGGSKSSLSRQGSIPSLDLRGVGLEGTDSEEGETHASTTRTSKTPSPSNDSNFSRSETPVNAVPNVPFQTFGGTPLTDKYSVMRSEKKETEDPHISDWTRCLQSCITVLQNAARVFNQMSCSSVCNEVLSTDEGKNCIKNVTEVYRVVCRISLASKSYNKQTDQLLQLLDEADQAWNMLVIFLTGSSLQPEDAMFDFSTAVLRCDPENNLKACALCLLNVDFKSKVFNKNYEVHKLTYGGRHYHSTCANLWVNCVDPLLPVLTLPQLL